MVVISVVVAAFFKEASAIGPNITISSGAVIAIKDPLFRISFRIDPPIGAGDSLSSCLARGPL